MHEDLPYGSAAAHCSPRFRSTASMSQIRLARTTRFLDSRSRRKNRSTHFDGAQVTRFRIGGECGAGSDDPRCSKSNTGYGTPQYELTADEALEVRFAAKAGLHSLGVAFVKKGATTEGLGATVLPPRHSSSTYEAPQMDMEYVRLEGPFNATGPGDTPSRRQIFVCRPARPSEEDSCAKKF
jgi:hypothetical protein